MSKKNKNEELNDELAHLTMNNSIIQSSYINEVETNPQYSLEVDPENKYNLSQIQKDFIKYYVEFKDIDCTNVNIAAGTFFGLPEQPIESIKIKNVNFEYSTNPVAGIPAMMDFLEPMKGQGLIFNYVNKVELDNVTFNGVSSEEVSLVNVDSFDRK